MIRRHAAEPRFAWPFGVSALLHGGVAAAALFVARSNPPTALPPVYRVNIVAAPPGERQMGVVSPPPPAEEPTAAEPSAPAPPSAETPPTEMAPPEAAPPARPQREATPNVTPERPPPAAPVPRAGGGPTGGTGTDVATVRTEGIAFPYPGYLNNVVRQIALNFRPSRPGALSAEVMFLVHRDGTVSNLRFVKRSGNYAFDLEAQGAVEAASAARGFGSLPEAFPDDVLPIFFSFDPRVIR